MCTGEYKLDQQNGGLLKCGDAAWRRLEPPEQMLTPREAICHILNTFFKLSYKEMHFHESTVEHVFNWIFSNLHGPRGPYPTKDEKKQMAQDCNIKLEALDHLVSKTRSRYFIKCKVGSRVCQSLIEGGDVLCVACARARECMLKFDLSGRRYLGCQGWYGAVS